MSRSVGETLLLSRDCELGSEGERAVVVKLDGAYMTLCFPNREPLPSLVRTGADYAFLRPVRPPPRVRSLQELAREALAVQDACNLCGVAQGFARAMIELGEHTNGTDERNNHPIAVLWADKIAHLTSTQGNYPSRVSAAYSEAFKLAEEVPSPGAG